MKQTLALLGLLLAVPVVSLVSMPSVAQAQTLPVHGFSEEFLDFLIQNRVQRYNNPAREFVPGYRFTIVTPSYRKFNAKVSSIQVDSAGTRYAIIQPL